MSHRRGSKGRGVLEYVKEVSVLTTEGVDNLIVIDLDLNPDEVAEIRKIDTYIEFDYGTLVPANLDQAKASIVLGTDPSNAVNGLGITAADLDDLEDEEVFYHHRFAVSYKVNAAATGSSSQTMGDKKILDFPSDLPLLVGRNIGMTTRFLEEVDTLLAAVYFVTTIYFKRRKGAPNEILNLIKH